MALVYHYWNTSLVQAFVVFVFCTLEISTAIPSVPPATSTLELDVCVDLPQMCSERIVDYHNHPSCRMLEHALECLHKVVQECKENNLEQGAAADHVSKGVDQSGGDEKDLFVTGSQSDSTAIDVITMLFHESISEYQENCAFTNSSTRGSNFDNHANKSPMGIDQVGWLATVSLVLTIYSNVVR